MRSELACGGGMARRLRIHYPGATFHVFQRGNNRCGVFEDDVDRNRFLLYLQLSAAQLDTRIHGFALMETHYHLLLTPTVNNGLPRTMKRLLEQYVRYFNRRHVRIGGLWSGRYGSVLIKDERQ